MKIYIYKLRSHFLFSLVSIINIFIYLILTSPTTPEDQSCSFSQLTYNFRILNLKWHLLLSNVTFNYYFTVMNTYLFLWDWIHLLEHISFHSSKTLLSGESPFWHKYSYYFRSFHKLYEWPHWIKDIPSNPGISLCYSLYFVISNTLHN